MGRLVKAAHTLLWLASLLMWAQVALTAPAELDSIRQVIDVPCPPQYRYVFPISILCSDEPARFFTETFRLFHASRQLHGLRPEEHNPESIHYVRLSATSSAPYRMLYNTSAVTWDYVYQNGPVWLQNAQTERYLTWRTETSGQQFLIETPRLEDAASFWFSADPSATARPLCHNVPTSRCEAYYVMSTPPGQTQVASRLQVFQTQSGEEYITLAAPFSWGDLPILLTRDRISAATVPVPESVTRTGA